MWYKYYKNQWQKLMIKILIRGKMMSEDDDDFISINKPDSPNDDVIKLIRRPMTHMKI